MMRVQSPLARVLLVATVALIGFNLRPFITSIGPLAGDIREHTGLGLQGMAMLTLVPMVLMGCVAFVGPALQSAFGARRSIIVALLVICSGCALRLLSISGWSLIATAALIGLGVAVIQAIFPGIIKREFAGHVGPMMGLYSAMLMGGGALGAVSAPAMSATTGIWSLGLAWFALPAAAALMLAWRSLPLDAGAIRQQGTARLLLARPRTWLLMLCFGLMNGGYTSVVAWLAPAYQELGWSAGASGGLLAVLAVSQALAALTVPLFARSSMDRRPWLLFTLVMQAGGFAGLALASDYAALAWVVMLGCGLGGCFALLLIVALDHLPDPAQAGALSALMQGGGFLIAAAPAWFVAVLHDVTGSYGAGWMGHLAAVLMVAMLTLRFSPKQYARVMRAQTAESRQQDTLLAAAVTPGQDTC
ncbi:cyanate transporter [Advenella mimigardefordensis]|uniref:Putative cyanate transport protein CynX n=1 Tax=Advenella mimigardefordensis (strain DSM 17166 / LMG 22922 / DPN7) TaxID=1247726 RepID=W0PB37_ADVMD|nr:cyanate transporter [Advenella mimigardefordensis]AHG62248.1 putative cyanate transport protein CynX [Advenella mimigardefordensis DPN7]